MKLVPRSLFGQVMLALAGALLVAQAVSAVLLYRAAENRREMAVLHAAAFRLAAGNGYAGEREGFRARIHQRRMAPGMAFSFPHAFGTRTSAALPFAPGEHREPELEAELEEILLDQGVSVHAVAIVTRDARSDPVAMEVIERRIRRGGDMHWAEGKVFVAAVKLAPGNPWNIVRVPIPPREPRAAGSLALQTLLIFAVLMAIMALMLRRITRPLAALTRQTEQFSTKGVAVEPMNPEGPEDIRRLIVAHNAMEARIGSMLDEKDVMLGAIGHDLKTPLAALRVRIESIADESQRARMATTIEDITQTLDDILSLARVGRSNDAPEPTELSALAASVVEEFEDMGEPAAIGKMERIALPIRPTWLKRALRNLVSNAVRYGGSAEVSLLREAGEVVFRIDDRGPGIPESRIAAMTEPFQRGESSRNRATGGAGLGLTLARAIAEQHGGKLVLANRSGGGMRAEIRLPAPA